MNPALFDGFAGLTAAPASQPRGQSRPQPIAVIDTAAAAGAGAADKFLAASYFICCRTPVKSPGEVGRSLLIIKLVPKIPLPCKYFYMAK